MIRCDFVEQSSWNNPRLPDETKDAFHVEYMDQAPSVGEFVSLPGMKLGKVVMVCWRIPDQKATPTARIYAERVETEFRPDF